MSNFGYLLGIPAPKALALAPKALEPVPVTAPKALATAPKALATRHGAEGAHQRSPVEGGGHAERVFAVPIHHLAWSPDVSECRRCRRCRSSVGVVSERCRLTLVSTVSEVSGLCLTGV